jgi:hypothetical protein
MMCNQVTEIAEITGYMREKKNEGETRSAG